jgi:ribosomal protein S18 acetylase RimI-like enzyme
VTALREAPDYSDTPPDEQKQSLKRQLADALLARLPGLQLYQFPYQQIAAFERISIEEARCRHRHVELNSPEGSYGIRILLRDDDASVTVPFWHERTRATDAFSDVWACLEAICKNTGYFAYDPQLVRVVELQTDAESALTCYLGTLCLLRETHLNGVTRQERAPGRIEIRELAKCSGVVLLAVADSGKSCGFAEISIGHPPVNGSRVAGAAAMTAWYIEPAFRGRGIGRRLLDSAQAWAASRGLGALAGLSSKDAEETVVSAQSAQELHAAVDTHA